MYIRRPGEHEVTWDRVGFRNPGSAYLRQGEAMGRCDWQTTLTIPTRPSNFGGVRS